MSQRQFVRDLQNALQAQANNKAAQLGKGQCSDFPEYKKVTGYIAGLEAAGQLAEAMLRQFEDATREADDKLPEMDPPGGDA